MKRFIAASLFSVATTSVMASENCDLNRGQEVYSKCVACHHVEPGRGHFVGPNLHSVIGRTIGSAVGFKFSRQMRKDDRSWDAALFDQFITAPAEMFPRTRMGFAGIKNVQDRNDLYCFLKKQTEES